VLICVHTKRLYLVPDAVYRRHHGGVDRALLSFDLSVGKCFISAHIGHFSYRSKRLCQT
jgi:hypothetical protein